MRAGVVVVGLLMWLVLAPLLFFGSFGAAFGGGGATAVGAMFIGSIVAGIAGFIIFIAGLVMKSDLQKLQEEQLRQQLAAQSFREQRR